MQLLTAEEVRRIEREGIARRGITGLELMERAGFATAEKMLLWRPELQEGRRRMIVLCGPGGNGGDGFVAARLLAERGWRVDLFWLGDPDRQPPDAAATRARWELVGETRPWSEAGPALARAFQAADGSEGGEGSVDVVLDALFGIGMSRPMGSEVETALAPILASSPRRPGPPVVAVDMPSGVCSDSGRPIGAAVRADLTLTFIGPKPGHCLLPGAALSGEVRLIRLLGGVRREEATSSPRLRLARGVPGGLVKGAADPYGHKYDHGHVLVVAGGVGRGGAARLAARGALRAGAGAVTVAPPPAALQENAARLDAIMLSAVADADTLSRTLGERRIDVVALGMGLGVGERTRRMAQAALASGAACVLDADALTSFASDPAPLFEALGPQAVLTPHAAEFARLFPDLGEELAAPALEGPALSKADAALEASRRAGCTVILKGPDTVIAGASRQAEVTPVRGDAQVPWLATAGSGDVLAGIVAGLMARGFAAFDAASAGVWLHARAARAFGPGLIAEDLPETLPKVFALLAAGEIEPDPL